MVEFNNNFALDAKTFLHSKNTIYDLTWKRILNSTDCQNIESLKIN